MHPYRTHGLDSGQPRAKPTLNVMAVGAALYLATAAVAAVAYYFNF